MCAENSNSRTVDAAPHPSALVESIRDIGYSLDTALADIIDNSITAGASRVEILADTLGEEPALGILDNGRGMSENELINAMRLGSRNPLENRDKEDLGRFGLGLKTASFSQCRKLTVLTRKEGKLAGAIWDLDRLAATNSWQIILIGEESSVRWKDRLEHDGTLVVWEKPDRLVSGVVHDSVVRIRHINAAISQAERHLRMVFHRYMERSKPLRIVLNGRELIPLDPFASKHPKVQLDPEEILSLNGMTVRIRSVTLPHHKEMTESEWDKIGGPEGHLKSQGFYIYRGDRLIISGGWLGLAKQSELTKLCRIRVEISNSMDAHWKIDVKKASAQFPPTVRDRLKRIIERFSKTSIRTFTGRGRRLTDEKMLPFWNRIQKDGFIVYRPDLDHPALLDFSNRLPDELKAGFRNCVSLLGSSLPMDSLYADMQGRSEAIRVDESDQAALRQALVAMVPKLLEMGQSIKSIRAILKAIDMFRLKWDETEKILEEFTEGDDETAN